MLLFNPETLVRNNAGLYPAMSYAVAQRCLNRKSSMSRPQPAELRQARALLVSVDTPVRVALSPVVCKSLCVVETSYQVREPATFLAGSAFRGQAEVNNARNPHIDVTIAQDVTGDGRIFANHAIIEATTNRLAGDQARFSNCECCWVIDYCDMLTIQFFLARALAASEIPLEVIWNVYGFGLGCNLDEIDPDEAREWLVKRKYLTADAGEG